MTFHFLISFIVLHALHLANLVVISCFHKYDCCEVQCRLVVELGTQSIRCFLHIQIFLSMPVIFLHELSIWSR